MKDIEAKINYTRNKIDKYEEHINYLRLPYKYFKFLNILPVDLCETHIKPYLKLSIQLYRHLCINTRLIIESPEYLYNTSSYIIQFYTCIRQKLKSTCNIMNELLIAYCNKHKIDCAIIDKSKFVEHFGYDMKFYTLNYIQKFDQLHIQLSHFVYDIFINEYNKLKNDIEIFEAKLLDTISLQCYRIPIRYLPNNCFIELVYSMSDVPKYIYVKKICKKIIKFEKTFNWPISQKTFEEFENIVTQANHYKVYKIDKENNKIGTYYIDTTNNIHLQDIQFTKINLK